MSTQNNILKLDYFSLLGLDQKYAIDPTHVHKNYLQLQKKYHPDYANHPDAEYISAHINQARQVILHDMKRAEYWCKLHHIPLQAKASSKLLALVFDAREALMESTHTQDADIHMQSIKKEIQTCLASFTDASTIWLHAYANASLFNPNDASMLKIASTLAQCVCDLQFLQNFLVNIDIDDTASKHKSVT